MTKPQLDVVIVGGGIGGLFAANALIANGLEVSVYEQAPALGEVGAGVYLTPNSVRHLQRVGLSSAVEKWGAKIGFNSQYFRHDGTSIAPVQVTDTLGWSAYGMHRADLVGLLASALPTSVVRTGCHCTGFEQDSKAARVSFADGAIVECDVVVGADGIHSVLREHAAPASQPIFSGSIAYRGVVATDRLPDWPANCWAMWLGPGKHFLTYPLRAGAMINFVAFVPSDEPMKESWSAAGDPDALRKEFSGWDPRVGNFLRQVTTTFRSALYDRDPLPTWTKGRLTLLGDAAHPMLPYLGQGANQSIEDGIALAKILASAEGAVVPAGLLAYERLRHDRTAAVQRGARQNGLLYDSRYADLNVRDAEIAALAEFRRQLYDYDVVLEARVAGRALAAR
jgi:2-polyprenyl-6-methoxyphenol hydroxylase-like FAD-dependent oxidoreductase